MKANGIVGTILFLGGISLGAAELAAADAPLAGSTEEVPPIGSIELEPIDKDYSGDFWTRSTLSGDWWGLRNKMAAKGVNIDTTFTQAVQGIVHGGKDTGWQYGGNRGDIILNVDTEKLGLWPGGFFNLEAEGNFNPLGLADSTNGQTGALMAVNSSQFYPIEEGDNFAAPAWNFTQFLSPYFGLFIGKLATLTSDSGDMNEFAHGKGDVNFMNFAFSFNPVLALTNPYSTLGTGLIWLPTKDANQAIVSFAVLSSTGNAGTSGFNDINDDNLTFNGWGRVRTNFFGLTGHQLFGYAFSNATFTSITQDDRIIDPFRQLSGEKGSWAIYYNFDQYLYQPEAGSDEGIGIFGRFGASDGNPNFMQFFYSMGFGGKGVIPSRPNDRYGFGFYYIVVNNPTITLLGRMRRLLRDEYGFELFYNFAITPWLRLTPDIQVVRGAQKETASIGTTPIGLPFLKRTSIGTATVLGFRLQIVF